MHIVKNKDARITFDELINSNNEQYNKVLNLETKLDLVTQLAKNLTKNLSETVEIQNKQLDLLYKLLKINETIKKDEEINNG